MLKSVCEELAEKAGDRMEATVTMLREEHNVNQYVFLDYMLFTGRAVSRRISRKHFSMKVASPGRIADFIVTPDASFACINDVEMDGARQKLFKETITEAFESHFPQKSKFEI